MATEIVGKLASPPASTVSRKPPSIGSQLARLLLPLASLKITVALFAMSIFLIFASTLAQVERDVWFVVGDYFNSWIVRIPLQVFLVPQFFNDNPPQTSLAMYFPGGALIGTAMGINLLAAHALRFKIQAKGTRLLAGLLVIALGAMLTWLVVLGGSGKEGIEGASQQTYAALWTAMKWSLVALWVAGLYALVRQSTVQSFEFAALLAGEIVLAVLIGWIFYQGNDAALGDSSLRITWQLIKAEAVSLVLLTGCILLFRKRAGIVLLHAGVVLMMANAVVVTWLHEEGHMQIRVNETVNFASDLRTVELALVDSTDPHVEQVVVIPRSLLEKPGRIESESLPCDVVVLDYFENSKLAALVRDIPNRATAGVGLELRAIATKPGSGTATQAKVDLPAAYVQLKDKKTDRDLGTYLVSAGLNDADKLTIDDKPYELSLRFKRSYKPYTVHLEKFHFDKYPGTDTPKNFQSDIHLVDETRGADFQTKIWMNNPLRYAGETLYQENTFVDRGHLFSELQVVKNIGWMIPYVACMVVITGMTAQFLTSLARFLQRRRRGDLLGEESLVHTGPAVRGHVPARDRVMAEVAARRLKQEPQDGASVFLGWLPAAIVMLLAGSWIIVAAYERPIPLSEIQLTELGRIPVQYEGRIKPLDTVARNMLRFISGKQSFVDDTDPENPHSEPAIKWFMDVVARPEVAFKYNVIRIENTELLESLGLKRRDGWRYSVYDLWGDEERFKVLDQLVRQASRTESSKLTLSQKKVIELSQRLRLINTIRLAFEPLDLADLAEAKAQVERIKQMHPPLVVPPDTPDGKWETFTMAYSQSLLNQLDKKKQENSAMTYIGKLQADYAAAQDTKRFSPAQIAKNVDAFNDDLAEYQIWLERHPPDGYSESKVRFESSFNHFDPFFIGIFFYGGAFLLVAASWLLGEPFRRAALWLVVIALLLQTAALASRVAISGYPPVTNLYSTAPFIGWAIVILGLVIEVIYRGSLGVAVSSVAGFLALGLSFILIALNDGDTMGVMQAVLDTQFWLWTHVLSVNVGYAATMAAGVGGISFVLWNALGGIDSMRMPATYKKNIDSAIYGLVCFAMVFSFLGTVLGGLWADDSWGRFWGWDPKENGALLIVLWNALVLHARWGGMVKERGMANLVVVGNIITMWSWFGVNLLSVGLHAYGFSEKIKALLGLAVLSQLIILMIGLLPWETWFKSPPQAAKRA